MDSKSDSGIQNLFHNRHLLRLVDRVEDLFIAHGAVPNPTSELSRLFSAARRLGSLADLEMIAKVDSRVYYDSLSFARLARSVINLDYRPAFRDYFHSLTNGSINFWNSARSKAKDVEWELYLWSQLNGIFPNAARLTEPDIELRLAHRKIGIACKRVYSFKRVIDQIGSGARQLRAQAIPGVVALSFDPYRGDTENYRIIKAPDTGAISRELFRYFGDIWKRISKDTIRKYLLPNRVIGLFISVQGFVQIGEEPNNIAEIGGFRLQTFEGTTPQNDELMDLLHRAGQTQPQNLEANVVGRLNKLDDLAHTAGRRPLRRDVN